MKTKIISDPMDLAMQLAERFGGCATEVQVGVGTPDGWGWADVVLKTRLTGEHAAENPYEFVAYDTIRDEWPSATAAVERGEIGADEKLRELLVEFAEWFAE